MAFDITVEGFDQDYFPLHLSVEGDVNLDDLMVIVADKCGISPAARTLFAFQQVTHKYYNQSEKLIIPLSGKWLVVSKSYLEGWKYQIPRHTAAEAKIQNCVEQFAQFSAFAKKIYISYKLFLLAN